MGHSKLNFTAELLWILHNHICAFMISIKFVVEKETMMISDNDVTLTLKLSKSFEVFANKWLNPTTILYIQI